MSEVTPEKVILTIKDSKDKSAKAKTVEIPSGFVLWSTGIGEFELFARKGGSRTESVGSNATVHEATSGAAAESVP